MSFVTDAYVATRQAGRDGGAKAGFGHVVRIAVRLLRARMQGHEKVEGIRRPIGSDRALCLPLASNAPPRQPALRVALVCHIFHTHLIDEISAALRNVLNAADIIVTTNTDEKRQQIEAAFAGWTSGYVDVRVIPNRGRDIAPKLALLPTLDAKYDVALFLHTKNSGHHELGAPWRRHLYQNLAGSERIVADILSLFAADRTLGMVAPQHHPQTRDYVYWTDNFPTARVLAKRMGFRLGAEHGIDFPSGSMFWCRPAALAPLLSLDLTAADFPEEQGQNEGTIAHAIERLFFVCCEIAGYRWLKVEVDGENAIALRDPDDLEAFHRRYGFRLTGLPIAARPSCPLGC